MGKAEGRRAAVERAVRRETEALEIFRPALLPVQLVVRGRAIVQRVARAVAQRAGRHRLAVARDAQAIEIARLQREQRGRAIGRDLQVLVRITEEIGGRAVEGAVQRIVGRIPGLGPADLLAGPVEDDELGGVAVVLQLELVLGEVLEVGGRALLGFRGVLDPVGQARIGRAVGRRDDRLDLSGDRALALLRAVGQRIDREGRRIGAVLAISPYCGRRSRGRIAA